jgi:hypothetical protein
MIAASSHVFFFYLSKVYPNVYIAVGYLLLLQEHVKRSSSTYTETPPLFGAVCLGYP